jgi:hypothetical protein
MYKKIFDEFRQKVKTKNKLIYRNAGPSDSMGQSSRPESPAEKSEETKKETKEKLDTSSKKVQESLPKNKTLTEYVVKKGDSLLKVLNSVLGEKVAYNFLKREAKKLGANIDYLQIGDKIQIQDGKLYIKRTESNKKDIEIILYPANTQKAIEAQAEKFKSEANQEQSKETQQEKTQTSTQSKEKVQTETVNYPKNSRKGVEAQAEKFAQQSPKETTSKPREAAQNKPQTKTEQPKETPITSSIEEAEAWAKNHETVAVNPPKNLKYAIDQEQIPYQARVTINETLNKYGITISQFQDMMKGNKLSLNQLLRTTISENDSDYKAIAARFNDPEAQELEKEIQELQAKAKEVNEGGIRYNSIQRRIDRKQNKIERKKQQFVESEIQKLNVQDYTSTTAVLEDFDDPNQAQDVQRRHNKIKDLVDLQKTMASLGNFEQNQANLTGKNLEQSKKNLSPDKIEFAEIDPQLEKSLLNKLNNNEWREANNISDAQAKNLEKIIKKDQNSLILLSTLIYSEGNFSEANGKAFYSYSKPGKEGAILRPGNFNEDNFLELLNLVSTGLYSNGTLRQNERINNLSEANYLIQNSPNYSAVRQAAYRNQLEKTPALYNNESREQLRLQAHLQRILDTNITGPYSVEKGIFDQERVSTQSQVDYMGGATQSYENPSTIKGKSELSLYNDLVDQISNGDQLDKSKFESKMQELMELGKIGMFYDPSIDKSYRDKLKAIESPYVGGTQGELLSPQAVTLIRYGLIYEDLYENFTKSDRSPDKKFEQAGINNPQMVYPAIAEALTVIETQNLTNLSVGSSKEKELGNGFSLEFAGAASASVPVEIKEFKIKHPSFGAGGAITLSKDLSDKFTWNVLRVSGGTELKTDKIANISLHGAVETGFDYKADEYTSLGAGVNAGIGKLLFIDGVPVPTLNFTLSGERRGIDKAEDDMYYTNVEKLRGSASELSPEGKAIMQKLRNGEDINKAEINTLEKELPFLREPFENDPKLQNISPDLVFEYQKAILVTMTQRLENISTEEARGLNVGVSFTVGTIIGTGVPYFIPTVQFEWKGRRVEKIQTLSNASIQDQTVIDELKAQSKNLSKGETLEFTTQSGIFIIDDKGEINILKPTEELSEIQGANYEKKLQSLRQQTGLNFQRTETNGKYKVSSDDFKLRQNVESKVQKSEELEIHIDPILKESIQIQGTGNGEFSLEFKDGKIPDNLLILREDRILPTTLGKANSFSKISFTTSERALTGSELTNLKGQESFYRMNKQGDLITEKIDNSLNRNEGTPDTLDYTQTLSPEEIQELANNSEYILSRTSERINQHRPKAELDRIVKKLTGDKATLEKLAEYTTRQLDRGEDIQVGKAIDLIKQSAGEDVSLNKEDLIYILGQVNPYTFRSINELTPTEREQAAEKLAKQYVSEYVTSLAENGYVRKSNGEKFSTAEQQSIINVLQAHSGLKESFRDNVLKEGNVVTEQIGTGKYQNLEGAILLTTAHRGKMRGLRQTIVSRVNPTEIIKDSYTDLNKEGIPASQLNLVKEFLVGIHDSIVPVENLKSYEDLTEKSKAAILRTLSSKTAMLMTNIRAFQDNGREIALIGLMYGPKNLEAINKFYQSVDSNSQFPDLSNPEEFQAIMQFVNDIQKVHNTYDGQVTFEDMNGNPVEINLETEAGVVLIGNCANPTYVYNRKMTANTQLSTPELGAARAKSTAGSFQQGKSKAKLRRIGFGTKLEPQPKTVPTETPRKTGDEIPGGGGNNETPRKTGDAIPEPASEDVQEEVTERRSDRADRANQRNN